MSKTQEAIIEEIVLDFQQGIIPTTTIREVELEPLPNKATVCMGVRRSGKSTLMMQQERRTPIQTVALFGCSSFRKIDFDDAAGSEVEIFRSITREYGLCESL